MEIRVSRDNLPILDQFSEEGFVDCVFKITNLNSTDDRYIFRMDASYNDERAGICVRLAKGIKPIFDAKMNVIKDNYYRNGVSFLRSGPESDRLISAVARLYGMDGTGLAFVPEETFTAVALHQAEIDLERESVKLKLFGRDTESDPAANYYESFFNVDLPNGLVYWNEKDPEYREPLLRALGGKR